MATAPPALQRRGHAFEGGGGRSTQAFGHVSGGGGGGGGGGAGAGGASERKSSSDLNWKKKHDLFGDDDDEDERPLSLVRPVRKGDPPLSTAAARAASPQTSFKGGSFAVGSSGSRGEVSASGPRKETGSVGVEKKRVLAEGGRVAGSSGGAVPEPPLSKKVKMVGSANTMEASRKRDSKRDEDDEDNVPLATRMVKIAPPTKDSAQEGSMAWRVAAAKKVKEDKLLAKIDGGLAGMANPSTTNGTTVPAKASIPRPLPKELPGRISNHTSGDRDEKKPEIKLAVKPPVRPVPPKPVARAAPDNWVPDSEDSDDDKPLSRRKSMSLQVGRDSNKPNSVELKETLTKKRPAGQTTPSPSNPSAVKKLKILPSHGQQSQKPPLQSPKSGSLHSPRTMVKKELDSARKPAARRVDPDDDDDDDDDVPLAQRIPSLAGPAKSSTSTSERRPAAAAAAKAERDLSDDDDDDHVPLAKRAGQIPPAKPVVKLAPKAKTVPPVRKPSASASKSLTRKVLEQRRKGKGTVKATKQVVRTKTTKIESKMIQSGGTQKWETLEHNGVIFPPAYQPHGVKMLYNGKPVKLTADQEEVATMFAVMKETEYATKPKFIENFWADWQPILGDDHVIEDFEGCNFTPIYDWFAAEKEKKKSMSLEEKKRLKEEKLKVEDKYMWALVNGVKEKVGNFRVEPPGLFRGRGEHPKMGKLKKRIFPENIVINVGKGAPIPECPMPGHRWKEIRHDNKVTWLAFWNDPINNKEFKYVFLAASSSLKGLSDMEKYEKARLLKDHIENIRRTYTKNFNSSDAATRQIAVATYLIDRLALRAGNEKDEDEADTVGCCSLKVEHVILVPPRSLTLDFLGKDSIRYLNTVEVEEKVYSAIGHFKKGKKTGNDLFDKLDTSKLNQHLKGIMPALTAKVFRTYNASITLDKLLQDTVGSNVLEKVADYQRANKEVAILCNHQRTVSKSHSSQMEKLEAKMTEAEELVQELKIDLDRARKGKPPLKDSAKRTPSPEALEKKIAQAEQKVEKMKLDMRIKDDLKSVALGTSKINYMDPRISVAWCKRHEVPIEKVFNKSLLAKFAWAMDVDPDYRF